MDWIYLSPHLDDAILSCGGLIFDQVSAGERVTVMTICAGDPPDGPFSAYATMLHERWDVGREAAEIRRDEDRAACRRLGTGFIHFDIPDCVYRLDNLQGEHFYQTDEAIFGGIDPGEDALVKHAGDLVKANLPTSAKVVCPVTLGNHVDHQITRQAAEQIGIQLLFYADYPYVLYDTPESRSLDDFRTQAVSDSGLKAWQDAVAEYRSQISTFWYDDASMRESIRKYREKSQGIRLWTGL